MRAGRRRGGGGVRIVLPAARPAARHRLNPGFEMAGPLFQIIRHLAQMRGYFRLVLPCNLPQTRCPLA